MLFETGSNVPSSIGMHDFLGIDTLGRVVEYDCCPYGKPDTYIVNTYKGSLKSVIKYLPDYKCEVEFADDHTDPIVMAVESGLAEKLLREGASMDEESSEDQGSGLSEYFDTVYYADKSVKSIVQGVNGYRHGRTIEFYKSGVPKTVRTYFMNKPGPMQMHYDKDGGLSQVRYNTDTVHFCVTFSDHKPHNVLYRKARSFGGGNMMMLPLIIAPAMVAMTRRTSKGFCPFLTAVCMTDPEKCALPDSIVFCYTFIISTNLLILSFKFWAQRTSLQI